MRIFEILTEAPTDPKFTGFMNQALGKKVDQPRAIGSLPDFMKQAPIRGLDSLGYRAALNFGLDIIKNLSPGQKIKLSTQGESGVVDWLAAKAKKSGLLPGTFMREDLAEVQDFLPELFKDPAITSWALVLTDGEPLTKTPSRGPFTIGVNPGLKGQNGYANAEWRDVETIDNLPNAKTLAQQIAKQNPKQFVAIWDTDGKSAGFYWPGSGWR